MVWRCSDLLHPILCQKLLELLTGKVSGIVRNSPGNPKDAIDFLMHELVVVNDDDEVVCTSNNLECASIIRRNMLPQKGKHIQHGFATMACLARTKDIG